MRQDFSRVHTRYIFPLVVAELPRQWGVNVNHVTPSFLLCLLNAPRLEGARFKWDRALRSISPQKSSSGVGLLNKKSREMVKYYQPWLIIGLDREESRYVHKNHKNQSNRLPRGRRCPVAARRNGIRRP